MVALLGLLAQFEVFLEGGLGGERGPVHPGQRVVLLVAAPVGGRDLEQRGRADLSGRLDVWALTEVLPVVLDVEGDLLVVGLLVEDLSLVLVVLVDLHGLLAGPNDAFDVVVGRDDRRHLVLDGVEVVLVEVDVGHVVVEPVVGRRTDRQGGLRVDPLEGLREDVGRGVAQHRQVLVRLVGDDLDPRAVVDRGVLLDEFAVDLARDGVATEAGADLVGDVLDCRPLRNVQF